MVQHVPHCQRNAEPRGKISRQINGAISRVGTIRCDQDICNHIVTPFKSALMVKETTRGCVDAGQAKSTTGFAICFAASKHLLQGSNSFER